MTNPRYIVKYANRVYHVFDTLRYEVVRAWDRQQQAEGNAKYLNAQPVRRRA